MPRVSVIIPTKNRSVSLRLAIESVLRQTFEDFEIIVIDDASTVRADEVVGSFHDERIKYVRLEVPKGASGARNVGLKNSNGEYIAFLDDDDEWLPTKLEKQVEVLATGLSNLGAVYTGRMNVDARTGKVMSIRPATQRGNLFAEVLTTNRVTTSSVVFKRECFENIGFFDESFPCSNDQDMWIRISQKYQWECIKDAMVRYGIHPHRLSTNSTLKVRSIERLLSKYAQIFAVNAKAHGWHLFELGTLYCLAGNVREGRMAYVRSIKIDPFAIKPYLGFFLSLFGTRIFIQAIFVRTLGGRVHPSDHIPPYSSTGSV